MRRCSMGTTRMGRRAGWRSAGIALVFATAAAPVAATGGAGPPETIAELQREALEIARGGELVGAAEMLVEATGSLEESAGSAELLVLAARLYGHAARRTEAYWTLRRAAEVAFRVGEAERAAHLLIDAAGLAMEDGRGARAQEAADLAGYVLRVSSLAPERRTAVLRRVEYPAG